MPFAEGSKAAFLGDLKAKGVAYKVETWTNYMENVVKRKAVVVQVDNEKQVQEVMRAVKKQNAQHTDHKISVKGTAGWADKEQSWCCFPWAKVQEQRYNESFSFSEGSVADVIIRFSPKYQGVKKLGEMEHTPPVDSKNPLDRLRVYEILVTAGVQIAKLAQKLRDFGLSLRTVSMLSWASAVGLAGTGGHGTGRDEPAFSGQVTGLRICDDEGNIREITVGDEDFATLSAAHSGALGIVLSMTMKVVEAFNLKETICNFPNAKTMGPYLRKLLAENQYFSLIGVGIGDPTPLDELSSQDKWQVRLWNHTDEAPTQHLNPPYAADARSLAQELSVRIGDSLQEFLLDSKLINLLPYYLSLAATTITEMRGTAPIVDHENKITHYQAAFPKQMRDTSYILPVKDEEAGDVLAAVLQKIEALIKAAIARGECPVTYAVYARYIKGSNGGLSTTSTSSDDEHILAIDIVTHPNAPGIANFEKELLAYFSEIGIKPRFHLGKNFPFGIRSYTDFLKPEAIAQYKEALVKWYGSEDALEASPFITPYFKQMLDEQPSTELLHMALPEQKPAPEHSHEECASFLEHLIPAIELLPIPGKNSKQLKDAFVGQCRESLRALKAERAEEAEQPLEDAPSTALI